VSDRERSLGIGRSRAVVLRLSGLFALDSLRWLRGAELRRVLFYLRFGCEPRDTGRDFFWANVLAGSSALLATRLAARFGLVRTMVFHAPSSNILLILVPLMPSAAARHAGPAGPLQYQSMAVPTRHSYIMAVVGPEERSRPRHHGRGANAFSGGPPGGGQKSRPRPPPAPPVFAGLLYAAPRFIACRSSSPEP